MEHVVVLEGAFASVKSDWLCAKIRINYEALASIFEGFFFAPGAVRHQAQSLDGLDI